MDRLAAPDGVETLSDAQVMDLWEEGRDLTMAGKAVALLARTRPGRSAAEWAREPVGARDAELLRWRGARPIACVEECPDCGSQAEFELDPTALLGQATEVPPGARAWSSDGFRLVYRLPDSADACHFGRSEDARAAFVSRCVRESTLHGAASDPSAWPDEVWEAVEADLLLADPLAEIRLRLDCPSCAAIWEAVLDVPEQVWKALARRGRGILEQVHQLASAYGWSEGEILALSPSRRELYLQRLERGA
jgi:hypothetical protein